MLPAAHALQALDTLPRLLAAPDAHARWMRAKQQIKWSVEFVLAEHYRASGLLHLVRRMHNFPALTVRGPDDRTRWSPGREARGLGLFVKYPFTTDMWPRRCVAMLLRAANASRLRAVVDTS